ncbi:MAG: hypothetical protein PHQ33_05545 [Bacteroidales bacterium]|nr:hypothetical protein [Bacteroidales bacterium]
MDITNQYCYKMKKFSLTSPAFTGECIFGFNENERLIFVDLSGAELQESFIKAILQNLPQTSTDFKKIKGRTGVVTEMIECVTFEMFWNRYDDKARSSKIKTERAWNKMSASERVKAYNYIRKYKMSLPSGICMKYATTYLSDQLWNN